MKKLCIIALAMALAAASLFGCTKQEVLPLENDVPAKPDIPEEETVTYPVSQIQQWGNLDSSAWELLQDLLPNYIVYRNRVGRFDYMPIDRSLPQSDYDWSNLVEVSAAPREVCYVENGELKTLKGIDVSTYQKEIDWEKVAASGVEFCFIRLGYRGYETGLMVVDDRFEENVLGATRNGIAVGVYFVTQAVSVEEAVEEARFVADTIAPYNITWPVVLDIEDAASIYARTVNLSQQERTDHAIAFCETIRELGYRPMLYCNIRWFIEELDIARIAPYDKWFAQYFRKPFFPYAFQVWQYTSSGSVDGIEGNVDMNISFVDYGNLPVEPEETPQQ